MNITLYCPECNKKLEKNCSCLNCSKDYLNNLGFVDFDQKLKIKPEQIHLEILSNIKSKGYSKGISSFIKKNSEFEYKFKKNEGNIGFRAIQKTNKRCLVINSDLGNIPENLSQIFDEVFSLDRNLEKISIQKYRFDEKNIKNIILIKSEDHSLLFADNYFDLIIIDGIKIFEKGEISEIKVSGYFKEIQRILDIDGCMCVGVKNKRSLKILEDERKNEINDDNYTQTFSGYDSIFKKLGFVVEPYWVLPSFQKPHYSGSINDDISLKWFLDNFDKFLFNDTKFAIPRFFLKKINSKIHKFLAKSVFPYYVFYCYKGTNLKNLEKFILKTSNFEKFIQIIRSEKILYILLEKNGTPNKILHCKNTKYDFSEKIAHIERKFPKFKNPNEKICMENWNVGEFPNRMDKNDIKLVTNWLINFQKETKSEEFSNEDLKIEVENLKIQLEKIEEVKDLPYEKWLNDYQNHISKLNFKKTGVHGDLQPRNILLNHDNSTVQVIDWDMFIVKGNPLIDFLWFTTSIMHWAIDDNQEFSLNLNGNGMLKTSLKMIKQIMNDHFESNLDFTILLRFIILRWITIKVNEEFSTTYLTYIKLLKTLQIQNFQDN